MHQSVHVLKSIMKQSAMEGDRENLSSLQIVSSMCEHDVLIISVE